MFGFIFAFVAGFLTRHAEEPVARPLAKALAPKIEVGPGEIRLLSFVVLMLAATLLAMLFHSGSGFWMMVGGTLGLFATRLTAAINGMIGRD